MARKLLIFFQKSNPEDCLINLNYLLKMSVKMFGRTKKEILIEQNLEKKLWKCNVDEGQIKQVLMNLFVNEWQAIPKGRKIIIKSEDLIIDDSQINELGLATAYGIIKSHKGMFRVQSEIGFGSSFMFYLPEKEENIKSFKEIEGEDQVFNGKGTHPCD
jgi:two-component system, cell cycle sensor histidine kinase and response regulator CckA